MGKLQHALGLLVLLYSLVVALPQSGESKQRSPHSSQHGKPFSVINDVAGNSGENTLIKNGRTISQTAWSIEDTKYSDEETETLQPIEIRDKSPEMWTFSKLLRLALNFVNKLRGENSLPSTQNNKVVHDLNSNKQDNEGAYIQAFKDWLWKNTEFGKEDLVLSSSPGSDFIPHHYAKSNYQFKESEKSHEKFGPLKNKKQNLKEIKDSKVVRNKRKNQQHHEKKESKVPTSKKLDSNSKEILTFDDEDCDSSEIFDSEEYDATNDMNLYIKRNQQNDYESIRLDRDESDRSASSEIKESSKPKIKFNINKFEVLNKSNENKPIFKINPVTKTSLDFRTHVIDVFEEDQYVRESIMSNSQTKKETVGQVTSLRPNSEPILKNSKEDNQYIEIQTTADITKKIDQFLTNPISKYDKSVTRFSKYLDSSEQHLQITSKSIFPNKLKAGEEYISMTIPPRLYSFQFKSEYVPKKKSNNHQMEETVSHPITASSISPSPTRKNNIKHKIPSESQLIQKLFSTTTPRDDYLPQTQSESTQKENPNYSRKAKTNHQVTLPINASSLETRGKNVRERNNDASPVTETVSQINAASNASSSQLKGKVIQDKSSTSKTEDSVSRVIQDNKTKEIIPVASQVTETISQNNIPLRSSTPETLSTEDKNSKNLYVTDSRFQLPSNISSTQIKRKIIQGKTPNYDQISGSVSQTDLHTRISSRLSNVQDIQEENPKNSKLTKSVSHTLIAIPQTQRKIIRKEKQKEIQDLNKESTHELIYPKNSHSLVGDSKSSKVPFLESGDDIPIYTRQTKTIASNQRKKVFTNENDVFKKDLNVDTSSSNPILHLTEENKGKKDNQHDRRKVSQTSENTKTNDYDMNDYDYENTSNYDSCSQKSNSECATTLSNELLQDTTSKSYEKDEPESESTENHVLEYTSNGNNEERKVKSYTKGAEPQKKFDTFLQFIYKHSNSSYFQALQEV